jgi:hypothetical protein
MLAEWALIARCYLEGVAEVTLREAQGKAASAGSSAFEVSQMGHLTPKSGRPQAESGGYPLPRLTGLSLPHAEARTPISGLPEAGILSTQAG